MTTWLLQWGPIVAGIAIVIIAAAAIIRDLLTTRRQWRDR